MKKLLLASAVAALSITAAQAAPTVYGKVFLSLDIQDGNDAAKNSGLDTRSQLNSNLSRLGVKGSEALTQDTDVVYQLEYRLETDVNGDRNWESRDTYLGLSNKKYGTLVAGRLTTIDDYINYAKVVKGGVVGGDDVLATISGPRANNAFAYFSPDYNGVQFMGMYALDEDRTNASTAAINSGNAALAREANDSFGRDAWGVGAKYEPTNAPYKAGLTYIRAGKALNAVRLSGAYAVNPTLTVAGQYQFTDFNTNNDENAFTVSGKYKVAQTPWTAYGQLDFVDNRAGTNGAERGRVAAGGEYSFNKNTTGHVYGAYMQDKFASASTRKSYGAGVGLEYKF